jgi:carbamoyl-phosphate synthase large subunit
VRGGDLIVKYTGDTVYLTGATAMCFEGEIEI